ncbi:MAG: hypothetical protein ACREQV_02940, partial [Candidatus Binatia bacterium]
MDAAVFDPRPTNQHPGHPLRSLESLITDFHPELSFTGELRQCVAETSNTWLEQRERDSRVWDVYGAVLASVLSLHRRSHFTDAADPRRIHIVETVVSPDVIEATYQKIWPMVEKLLYEAPSLVTRSAIDAAIDWLRIGSGRDRPFGVSHPPSSIKAAKQWGTKLIRELVPVVAGKPGLMIYLERYAAWFGIQLRVQLSHDTAAFFVDIDRREDWEKAVSDTRDAIKATSEQWASEDPVIVVRRLVELRTQLEIARVNWPNRVECACQAIAGRVPNPAEWVEAALVDGLF